MSKALLQKVITSGVDENLNDFLLSVSNFYTEKDDDLADYDDERFANFKGIGEINFEDGQKMVVVTADITRDLTERSGKKDQYEKAKRILKSYTRYDAGIFIFSDATGNFRLSLVYGTPDATRTVWSNFRRFTYYASSVLTNKTFLDRVGKCSFANLDIIKDAFSVEKVNKLFYEEIAQYFYRLTGKNGNKRELVLPYKDDDGKSYEEFAIRLIGRSIFCWFLKHKKSTKDIPLISEEALSSNAAVEHENYYHSVLEPIFFELMNKPIKDRKPVTVPEANNVPFLNGGLFEPHVNDYYPNIANYGLKIPDKWFIDFLAVLEQYNFTIDENSTVDADVSVDPEMLGRIFENLLAEVDPFTGETARKATGSYYTPRTIVDYMVEQSLKQYLHDKTGLSEETLISLLSHEDDTIDFNEKDKNIFVTALKEIRIIDPACGSGAFPMGILHRMLAVMEKVDPRLELWRAQYLKSLDGIVRQTVEKNIRRENWAYIRKLMIIRDSIYGVDIQPIAVEIAKLRCFLSLVVDETVIDGEENRGIEPLPNLEFKFVAANTLIGLTEIKDMGIMENRELIDELATLRKEYFGDSGENKEKIKLEFKAVQAKLSEHYRKLLITEKTDLTGATRKLETKEATQTQLLSEWDPFSYRESAWFDPKWMFGEDSFDIVIANPPYLGEKGHREIFGQINKGTLKEYYLGKMDLLYFFFHLALNLGSANAQIAFITTNYYPTAFGATKLRKDFKERAMIRKLINFNELKIFESALGQHNMVTILSKGHDSMVNADTCITKKTGLASAGALYSILLFNDPETSYFSVPQESLFEGEECYIRLTGSSEITKDPLQRILNLIKRHGELLGDICNVNNGIFAGADSLNESKKKKYKISAANVGDGIFILRREEVADLNPNAKERKIIKPLFKNSQIHRYFTEDKNDLFIINLRYTDRPDIDNYPNIKRHLSKYKKLLSDRPRTGTLESAFNNGYWYVMSTSRKVNMDSSKIVAPQRSPRNTFGYNEIPWYASADVYFITEKDEDINLKYCLALLNSKLYYLWLYHKGKRKGEMLELYQVPLSEIPIKKISKTDQKPFVSVVDKILALTQDEDYISNPAKQAKVGVLESQIDQLVYQLYGLIDEAKAVVEGKVIKGNKDTIITTPDISPTEEVELIDQKENREEEAQMEIILTKDKETPGTWRYKEQKEDHPLTIYLTKEQVKELDSPESIKITITAA